MQLLVVASLVLRAGDAGIFVGNRWSNLGAIWPVEAGNLTSHVVGNTAPKALGILYLRETVQ